MGRLADEVLEAGGCCCCCCWDGGGVEDWTTGEPPALVVVCCCCWEEARFVPLFRRDLKPKEVFNRELIESIYRKRGTTEVGQTLDVWSEWRGGREGRRRLEGGGITSEGGVSVTLGKSKQRASKREKKQGTGGRRDSREVRAQATEALNEDGNEGGRVVWQWAMGVHWVCAARCWLFDITKWSGLGGEHLVINVIRIATSVTARMEEIPYTWIDSQPDA